MAKRRYEIDGRDFTTLEEFYEVVSRVLFPGAEWGHSLDAPSWLDSWGILMHNSSGTPQTVKTVDLPGRIRAAGGASLKETGEFFGWEPGKVTKAATDFTKDQLLAKGWTKQRLVNVAEGYEHIARITPNNPSAAGRAEQLREISKLLD